MASKKLFDECGVVYRKLEYDKPKVLTLELK